MSVKKEKAFLKRLQNYYKKDISELQEEGVEFFVSSVNVYPSGSGFVTSDGAEVFVVKQLCSKRYSIFKGFLKNSEGSLKFSPYLRGRMLTLLDANKTVPVVRALR